MVKGVIYNPLDTDCLLALWPLLLLISLVTCKVWSFDLYLKKLPCNTVYITHTEFNKAPLFHQRLGSTCPSFSLSPSIFFSFFHFLIVDSGHWVLVHDPNMPGVLHGGPAFQRAGAESSAPPWADGTAERHARSCRGRSRSLLTSARGPPGLREDFLDRPGRRRPWLRAQSNSSPKQGTKPEVGNKRSTAVRRPPTARRESPTARDTRHRENFRNDFNNGVSLIILYLFIYFLVIDSN